MFEKISIYFSIFISSAVKFIAGPAIGMAADLAVFETAFFTTLGMMSTVVLFTFFGKQTRLLLSRFRRKKRKVFSRRSRRFVYIWKHYGILGTAFLTPLFLTPIGGAIIANAFKSPKQKLLTYMFLSALFWAVVLSWGTKYLKDIVIF